MQTSLLPQHASGGKPSAISQRVSSANSVEVAPESPVKQLNVAYSEDSEDGMRRERTSKAIREVRKLRMILGLCWGLVVLLYLFPPCTEQRKTILEGTTDQVAATPVSDKRSDEISFENSDDQDTETSSTEDVENSDDSEVDLDFVQPLVVSNAEPSLNANGEIPAIDPNFQVFMGHRSTNTGWVVDTRCFLNPEKRTPLIGYGIGCGEDVSWDVGMVTRYGFEMFLFDPTPKSIKYVKRVQKRFPNRITFTPEGLSTKKGVLKFTKPQNKNHVSMRAGVHSAQKDNVVKLKVNTLRNWMATFNHTYLDVFKIDIEGSEYDVLEQFLEEGYFPFTQLLIEFHQRWFTDGFRNPRHQAIKKALKKAGFIPYRSRHAGQEVSYIKLADLDYCVNGGEDKRSPYVKEYLAKDKEKE